MALISMFLFSDECDGFCIRNIVSRMSGLGFDLRSFAILDILTIMNDHERYADLIFSKNSLGDVIKQFDIFKNIFKDIFPSRVYNCLFPPGFNNCER